MSESVRVYGILKKELATIIAMTLSQRYPNVEFTVEVDKFNINQVMAKSRYGREIDPRMVPNWVGDISTLIIMWNVMQKMNKAHPSSYEGSEGVPYER